jgi:hypothetical protein
MSASGALEIERRLRRRWFSGAVLTLALTALGGCQRDEVAHFRVPKERPAAQAAAAAGMGDGMGGGMGGAGADLAPAAVSSDSGLRWKLPQGWKEAQGGGQMRYATLTPPVPGKVDVSVIVLPGSAGGELANVNRWRNQIGLPPLDEAGMSSGRKMLKTAAGELSVYDFSSEGTKKTRTIAGLTSVQGNTWFLKMTGDAEAVATAGPAFLDLLGSVHLETR